MLEDCDILVQVRDSDLRRGAVISNFHRHLAYSRAVVIMTTSRVFKFDPALLSRVHLVLRFPDFSFDKQKDIWKGVINHLNELEPDDKTELRQWVDYDLELLDGGVYTKMNGRQIRNCISAASALARGDKHGSE